MFNFRYIILSIALLIGLCSAFVSITGLSKLFAGAGVGIIILMGALELGKLITAISVHRYWDRIGAGMRAYLIAATIVLVGITSMGLYGYLSDSYTKAKVNMAYTTAKVDGLSTSKTNIQFKIDRINQSITTKTERLKSISDIRERQETRMDSLILNGKTSQSNRIREDIKSSDRELTELNNIIDSLNNNLYFLNDSIARLDIASTNATTEMESNNELGPIIYISKLTGVDMDSVVNYLILIIVMVFDPLGIMLLILSSKIENKEGSIVIEDGLDYHDESNREVTREIQSDKVTAIEHIDVKNNEPEAPPAVEAREPIIPKGRIDSDDIAMIRSKLNRNNNRGFSVNVNRNGNRPIG